jgi:hypothetical protein
MMPTPGHDPAGHRLDHLTQEARAVAVRLDAEQSAGDCRDCVERSVAELRRLADDAARALGFAPASLQARWPRP